MWFDRLSKDALNRLSQINEDMRQEDDEDIVLPNEDYDLNLDDANDEPYVLTDITDPNPSAHKPPQQQATQQVPQQVQQPLTWQQQFKQNPDAVEVTEENFEEICDYADLYDNAILAKKALDFAPYEALQKLKYNNVLRNSIPEFSKYLLYNTSFSSMHLAVKGQLSEKDISELWNISNDVSSASKILSLYSSHIVKVDRGILEEIASKYPDRYIRLMPKSERARLNVDMNPYLDRIPTDLLTELTANDIASIPEDKWGELIKDKSNFLYYFSRDLLRYVPESVRDWLLNSSAVVDNVSYYTPYLTTMNLYYLRENYPFEYNNLMNQYADSLDPKIRDTEIEEFKQWLYNTKEGAKYVHSVSSYLYESLPEETQKSILENVKIDRFSQDIINKMSDEMLWDKVRESNNVLSNDIYRRLNPEQLLLVLNYVPNAISYWSSDIMAKLDMEKVAEVFLSQPNNYYNVPEKVKDLIGKRVLNFGAEHLAGLLDYIPEHVYASFTDEDKTQAFEKIINSHYAETARESIWKLVTNKEQARQVFEKCGIERVPMAYSDILQKYIKEKYDFELPVYYKRGDLTDNFTQFYRTNPDTRLNEKFRKEFGKRPSVDIDSILGSWDSGYKDYSNPMLMMHVLEKVTGVESPLNKENEAEQAFDAASIDDENVKALAWGLNKVYENTQDMFKQMGITHLPVARYVGCSITKVFERFQPEIVKEIEEKFKLKKPFMLTFENQPFQVRNLASCTFNPLAIWSGFGYPKSPSALTVKWFLNLPVENILAVKGSLMLSNHSSEDEVISYNAQGLPATLVITYDYDPNQSYVNETNLNMLKNLGKAVSFNKKSIDLVDFEKNDVMKTSGNTVNTDEDDTATRQR